MKGTLLNFLIGFLCLFIDCKIAARENDSENYEVYANQIINSFAQEMKKEFGLICIGDGGRMPYDVEVICIKFNAYQRATIEEARELEVKVTEMFMKAINTHQKIRPFLREYPVRPFRAEVEISFVKKNHEPYKDGSVTGVLQLRNKIFYKRRDSTSRTGFVTLLEEPYEDALKIVGTQ